MLLTGDTAIVTGAGGPIGRAIAQAMAAEGASLLLTDIAVAQGQATADAITEQGGLATFAPADLSDAEAPQRLFELSLRQMGKVSIFVHCASPAHYGTTLSTTTEDAWAKMLGVSVLAACRFGNLLAQHMREKKINGRMLFITSLHARSTRFVPHYSVAKSGLTMLMREFASTLGPFGIRVNAIAPGLIAPETLPIHEPFGRAAALRRIGKPEELANTAIGILSERFGSFITGTTVTVDGGLELFNWLHTH